MARVRLENVRKVYGVEAQAFVAVHGADLEVRDGELLVLVGPSGCGKSTLLRMIAGLETISEGRLSIGDRVVNDVPPKDRDIAMVFQNYALYPHMTVYENLAFGLKLRKLPGDEIDRRVREAGAILELAEILDRRPRQLSGGQRQRVALGRAIVRQPAVFLFDEPLSNLDAKLRVQTRGEIARLHRRLGATMIYVTHDQVEAMTLGERIVVLNEGRIQQIDTPLGLYERPANRFVAGFIGSPAMNLVEGVVERPNAPVFRALDGGLTINLTSAAVPEGCIGQRVTLGIRPENIRVAGSLTSGGTQSEATLLLDVVESMGNEIFVYARSGNQAIVARVPPEPLPAPGEPIRLVFDLDKLHFFDSTGGDRLGERPGARGCRLLTAGEGRRTIPNEGQRPEYAIIGLGDDDEIEPAADDPSRVAGAQRLVRRHRTRPPRAGRFEATIVEEYRPIDPSVRAGQLDAGAFLVYDQGRLRATPLSRERTERGRWSGRVGRATGGERAQGKDPKEEPARRAAGALPRACHPVHHRRLPTASPAALAAARNNGVRSSSW